MQIEATNAYAGTANFKITSEAAAGTIYGDAAVVQTGPARAETDWKTDLLSTGEFVRIERVLLKAGMSNDAANAEAITVKNDSAWPRSVPPDEYALGKFEGPDRLSLSLFGYIFTLKFRYSTTFGTNAMSTQIAALAAQQSDYLTAAGIIVGTVAVFGWQKLGDPRALVPFWIAAPATLLALVVGSGAGTTRPKTRQNLRP